VYFEYVHINLQFKAVTLNKIQKTSVSKELLPCQFMYDCYALSFFLTTSLYPLPLVLFVPMNVYVCVSV